MSVALYSLVQTDYGLLPISAVSNVLGLWSGRVWLDVEVRKVKSRPALQVKLCNGLELVCSTDQTFLTHGAQTYTWRRAGELVPKRHFVCISQSEPHSQVQEGYEVLDAYWFGWLLQRGRLSSDAASLCFDLLLADDATLENCTLLVNGLLEVARAHRWVVKRRRYGQGYSFWLYGKRFTAELASAGVWFESGKIARIPPKWLMLTTPQRRVLVRGILAASSRLGPNWVLEGAGFDEARAQDFLRLFASVGLVAQISGVDAQYDITVPTWTASLELGTPTQYPRDRLFLKPPGTPQDRVLQTVEALGRVSSESRTVGPLKKVLEFLQQGKPIAPAALRAAWRSQHKVWPQPIYDTVEVEAVIPLEEYEQMRSMRVHGIDHSIAVNGCVLGDDTR